MNVETQMDAAKSLRTHKVKGLINFQDLSNLLKGIYNSADFDPNLHSLWDVRDADLSAVKPEEIRALAEYVRANWAMNRKNKAAIVVSGLSDFGISRMYEQILGPAAAGKVMVFRNIKSAWDWIEGKPAAVLKKTVPQTVPASNPPV
jgi:hypothetical protein